MLPGTHKAILLRAIAELERKIEKSKAKKAEIIAQFDYYKGKNDLAPVRSLPVELLTEVFKLAVAAEEEEVKTIHGQPLLLDWHWNEYNENRLVPQGLTVQEKISHVCQMWREVSLATPSLWKRITIAMYAKDEFAESIQLNHNILYRMLKWIERTKNTPLDVTIFSSSTPLLEVWKIFEPMAARLQSLRVYDQKHYIIQDFVNSLPEMPLLETLHLGASSTRPYLRSINNLLPWKAPQLKELYVERIGLTWNQLPLSCITKLVILSRETHVMIPYSTFNMVLGIISPQLQTLVYQDHERPASLEGLSAAENFVFPHLDTLEVNVLDIRYIAHWLRHFSFPSLRRVYLDIQTQTGLEFNTLLAAAMTGLQGPNTDKKDPAKQPMTKEEEQQQRICFQRCEELTMGPCGHAHHGLGQFIITAFPSIRNFVSHPDESRFPVDEIFALFQSHCPQLTEIAAHSCTFYPLYRLIKARSLHKNLASLSRIVLESVQTWTESNLIEIRGHVELAIEDGQEGLSHAS
jgi:hypothetical protein